MMSNPSNWKPKLRWITIAGVALLLAVVGWSLVGGGKESSGDLAKFEVARGDLVIDVLEGGSIRALDSFEIRNQVRTSQGTKILSIIEEGYEVTPEDIENKKVLVELDPSELEERIVDHDLEFQQTESIYAETKQNLEVQLSENQSEIKAVRQILRFGLLDFEKFVGKKASAEILQSLDLPYDDASLDQFEAEETLRIRESFSTANLLEEETGSQLEAPGAEEGGDAELVRSPESGASRASKVKFSAYLEGDQLGEGEAEQTIRRLQDTFLVAKTELAVVEESVAGAKRLFDKGFITRTTLDNELVNLEKGKLAVKTAETELALFRDYEFPKEAEKMLSNCEEALMELLREKREAIAQMLQAEAKYRSYRRRYELELKKRDDLQEQLESCVIYAAQPGLVAYGGTSDNYYTSRYYESISQGATLKLGQPIITIPDMSRLAVEINVHESHIKKVALGQRAIIEVDAVPDRRLEGTVTKLAVLPDSNASRYNPSLKVYPATVEIDGTHDWLKPGMTAKVKVIVSERKDVHYIPVQAVHVENDEHFVLLPGLRGFSRRNIEVGEHNDDFIEVVSGLEKDEAVLLSLPEGYDPLSEALAGGRGKD